MGINVIATTGGGATPNPNNAVAFATTGFSVFPYGTTAAVVYDTSVLGAGNVRNLVMSGANENSDDIDVINLDDAANLASLWIAPAGGDSKGPSGIALNHWSIVVVGKDTGTVAPRCHVFDFTTGGWSHGNGSTTLADSVATGQADYSVNGYMNSTFAGIEGDIAAVATWYKRNLSDGEVERLAAGSWNRYSPDVLIEFRSGRAPLGAGPLDHGRQRMKTANFGSAITRSARADPPGFRWSLSGRRR